MSKKVKPQMTYKILEVTDMLNMGGIESYIMNIIRSIDSNQFHIDFIRSIDDTGPFDEELNSHGCCFYYLKDIKSFRDISRHIVEFKHILETVKPDVIHFHCCVSYACYDAIIAKKFGVKRIIVHSHSSSVIGRKRAFLHMLMRFPVSCIATDRIACSDGAGKWMFGKKPFEVIPNGIDLKKYTFNSRIRDEVREELGCKDSFLLGTVGRMTRVKNQTFLLDLLHQLVLKDKRYKLLLIGDGELREELENRIQELEIDDSVIIIAKTAAVYRYYNAMDCFLMPSLYEGMPIAGIEAQVNGLPSLFSDTISPNIVLAPNSVQLPISKMSPWEGRIMDIMAAPISRNVDLTTFRNCGYNLEMMANLIKEKYIS